MTIEAIEAQLAELAAKQAGLRGEAAELEASAERLEQERVALGERSAGLEGAQGELERQRVQAVAELERAKAEDARERLEAAVETRERAEEHFQADPSPVALAEREHARDAATVAEEEAERLAAIVKVRSAADGRARTDRRRQVVGALSSLEGGATLEDLAHLGDDVRDEALELFRRKRESFRARRAELEAARAEHGFSRPGPSGRFPA